MVPNDIYHAIALLIVTLGLGAWFRGAWRSYAAIFAVTYGIMLVSAQVYAPRYIWPLFPFLGFGFLPASVQRLGNFHDESMDGKVVTGTRMDFTAPEWARIEEEVLGGRWSSPGGNVFTFVRDLDLRVAAPLR